jgi:DNA-binding PadR family transcriptional regulator
MSTIHAVLGVLAEGECHGYEIATRLADRVGAGPYNSGQIHQALEIIERKGWARGDAETLPSRARRSFSITPEGRREFVLWLSRPIPPNRAQRDDVVLKMVFLAEHDVSRLIELLEERKREYVRRLGAYQRQSVQKGTARDVVRNLVRDKFALQDESEIEWIERCLVPLRGLEPATARVVTPVDAARRRRSQQS